MVNTGYGNRGSIENVSEELLKNKDNDIKDFLNAYEKNKKGAFLKKEEKEENINIENNNEELQLEIENGDDN